MRYVYMVLIVAVTALVLVFKFQNLETVTLAFFSVRLTLPVSILVILIYVLGMLTGSMVTSVLRGWIRGASRQEGQ
jgi:lipopolysaccharide assembly protein A